MKMNLLKITFQKKFRIALLGFVDLFLQRLGLFDFPHDRAI